MAQYGTLCERDSPQHLPPMWFSHTSFIILQLHYPVCVGRGGGTGELVMGFCFFTTTSAQK